LKASSLFAKDELDEVEDEAMDIRKQLVKRSIASEKAIDQYAANAMKDDPNIFDYDGAYDQMQSAKQNSMNKRFAAVSSEAPKSRYIGNLQAASQLREKEQERIFERKLIKERELEDTLYGDQPKYVTTAYKEKLLESKKWDYEDKMMEEVEKKHDVRSLGMQGFFSSLLTKNVAMGGDVKANAISAYTAGSERQEQVLEDRSKPGNNSSGSIENDSSHRQVSEDAPSSSMKRPRSPSEEEQFPVSSLDNKHSADQSSVASPVPKMQRKEDAVLSARERYLARKKQTSMGPSGVEPYT
jgi:coiled-coil domain-containing protein 55